MTDNEKYIAKVFKGKLDLKRSTEDTTEKKSKSSGRLTNILTSTHTHAHTNAHKNSFPPTHDFTYIDGQHPAVPV